ncbi:hypothetical protein R3W88_029844 [Solanum pinnatisectum]|uniref:Uncharacterized protein n=1 Tax=Solanum pinnatisectum TaxID=50273 RepID=A0AAV9K8K9_9SOLN|nr:hypothetical protein R3W88_029844 [Solanum pinnatisectum]
MGSSPATFSETVRVSSSTDSFALFTVEASHLFYIHPFDNPNNPLVSPPFDGRVITGRNPQPDPNSPYYSAWDRCNDMLIAWMTNSLTRDISISLIGYNTAKDIWLD